MSESNLRPEGTTRGESLYSPDSSSNPYEGYQYTPPVTEERVTVEETVSSPSYLESYSESYTGYTGASPYIEATPSSSQYPYVGNGSTQYPQPSFEGYLNASYGSPNPYDGQVPYMIRGYGNPGYNTLSIVSIISSFFIGIVGVITGAIALSQIPKTGEKGKGFAIAGIVIGAFGIFLNVIGMLLLSMV